MPENIIELKDVFLSLNQQIVLDEIRLTIKKGEYVGLIGPNGAGKTSLMKVILGLIKPDSGEVKLFGTKIEEFKHWHRIGYVPQKAISFDPDFPVTVKEIVAMGRVAKRGMFSKLNDEDSNAIHKAMQTAGIEDLQKRNIGELSGGQQQRVFIARALASEPELLILDEPTTGVDESSQHEFYHFLHELNIKQKITLVLISHDVSMVNLHVNRLLCINKKLLEKGCSIDFVDHMEHHTEMRGVRHRH